MEARSHIKSSLQDRHLVLFGSGPCTVNKTWIVLQTGEADMHWRDDDDKDDNGSGGSSDDEYTFSHSKDFKYLQSNK